MTEEIDYTKWEYPESDLKVLEEFNGYVVEIDEKNEIFWIECEDSSGECCQMEIPISKLKPEELPYLKKDYFCRLRVYQDPECEDDGIVEFIFYKRTWSQEEIDEAERKGAELAAFWRSLVKETDTPQ